MAILFGSLTLFMILSIPIGVSLGLASLVTVLFAGQVDLNFVMRSMVTAYDSFPLLAIPLFLLAGEIMSRGGISERLFALAQLAFGRFTGGVPMAVVCACLLFGALSGSAAADTAAIGTVMIPMMVRMGYPKAFSASLVASAGGLAIIMPPSMPMVLYGVSSNTSIGKLFMAGIIPAIVIGIAMMLYCYFYCRIKGLTNDKLTMPQTENFLPTLRRAILPLFMPVIILGGIYGGIFTPTEAAGVAVIFALFLCTVIFKKFKMKDLLDTFWSVSSLMGSIMIILGAATIFSKVLVYEHIPEILANSVIHMTSSPLVFLLIINVFFLIVGTAMDTLAAIIILAPILMPITDALGIDPVHFGLVMIVNLAIAIISPPLAPNLYIVSLIADIPHEKLNVAILGPILLLIACLLLFTYVPSLSLFLVK